MTILSASPRMGALSYLRFIVAEPVADIDLRGLQARRFTPLTPSSESSESVGWVVPEAPFDDERVIGPGETKFGEFVVVAYRQDRYVIPTALVQREVARMVKAHLEDNGDDAVIGKGLRKAMKDAAIAKLRSTTTPKSKVIDLVWDTVTGKVRVFGRGTIVHERVLALFERTFGVKVTSASRGLLMLATVGADRLAELAPLHLAQGEALPPLPPTRTDDEVVRRVDAFIGRDFLAWLYFAAAGLGVGLPDSVAIAVGKRASLTATDGSGPRLVLAGGGIDAAKEVAQALRRGAGFDRLDLDMQVGNLTCSVSLTSAAAAAVAVKLGSLFSTDEGEVGVGVALGEGEDEGKTKAKPPAMPLEYVFALRMQVLESVEVALDALMVHYVMEALTSRMLEPSIRMAIGSALGDSTTATNIEALRAMSSPIPVETRRLRRVLTDAGATLSVSVNGEHIGTVVAADEKGGAA